MKKIIGISDMQIGDKHDDLLITYSLGSCIGVALWDPEVKVGGLLHYMLPDSSIDKARGAAKPFMFANTGIPRMFKEMYDLGADKNRMKIYVVGGSHVADSSGLFNIGKRNYMVLRKIFSKNKLVVTREDVGGSVNRTISLEVGTGKAILKVAGKGVIEL